MDLLYSYDATIAGCRVVGGPPKGIPVAVDGGGVTSQGEKPLAQPMLLSYRLWQAVPVLLLIPENVHKATKKVNVIGPQTCPSNSANPCIILMKR